MICCWLMAFKCRASIATSNTAQVLRQVIRCSGTGRCRRSWTVRPGLSLHPPRRCEHGICDASTHTRSLLSPPDPTHLPEESRQPQGLFKTVQIPLQFSRIEQVNMPWHKVRECSEAVKDQIWICRETAVQKIGNFYNFYHSHGKHYRANRENFFTLAFRDTSLLEALRFFGYN